MPKNARGLIVVLFLAMGGRSLLASPPAEPPPTEEEKKLTVLIGELDAKKDVGGLLVALRATDDIRPPRRASVVSTVMTALGHVGPEELNRQDVIEEMKRQIGRGQPGAIGVLARIGTEPAEKIILETASDCEFWLLRQVAVRHLGKMNTPKARAAVIDIMCRQDQRLPVREAAFAAFEKQLTLDGEDYRRALDFAVTHVDDTFAEGIFFSLYFIRDLHSMDPLLESLAKLSERIDAMAKDEEQRKHGDKAFRCYDRGMHSLNMLVQPVVEQVGYKLVFEARLSVWKDGKERISYDQGEAVTRSDERKRVLAFWTAWWQENREAVLKDVKSRSNPKASGEARPKAEQDEKIQ